MHTKLQIQTLAVRPIRANCYILSLMGREDCVLIDPGAEPDRILAAANGRQVAAVLLTHGHFDHIGGVDGVLAPETRLYIHSLDEPMLRDPDKNMAVMIGQKLMIGAKATVVQEGDIITAAGITFTVLHTPGHTGGSVCLQCENAIFSGDTLFWGSCGRTDLPGGDWAVILQSLKRLKEMTKDYKVYPGHGCATTLADEQKYNPYMRG